MLDISSKILFPGEFFERISEYISWTVCIISTLFFILAIYVILTKSPKEMSVYRWFVLWNIALAHIFDWGLTIGHPFIIFPYPTFVVNGLFSYFNISFGNFNKILAEIVISAFGIHGYSLALMFAYRYAQSSNKLLLLRLFSLKNMVILSGTVLVGGVILVFWSLNNCFLNESDVKNLYKNYSMEFYEKIKYRSVVGFKVIPEFNEKTTLKSLSFIKN